jgi:hypothetical protein
VLLLDLTARSLKSGTRYADENFWIPLYSSNVTLVDLGLELTYLGHLRWKVTATAGVGAYGWLTEPARVVGFFDNNAVFLGKGEERVFDLRCNKAPRMRIGFGIWLSGRIMFYHKWTGKLLRLHDMAIASIMRRQ